ncbi:MAG: DUF808 domain-containing protein [Pseudomonadota bacterium]
MSGILALLDDIAAIAKLAAAQVDDIAAQAAKAGAKSAGIIIDDAAVTPKYVTGLPAARELPIVAKIARGSLFNKLVILLPVLLLLQAFAPWIIPGLLIIGGCYLCFEGAEKIWHALSHHKDPGPQQAETLDAAHLEEQRVAGAIKTDFILSAEIMTIALATIETDTMWKSAIVLAIVAVLITVVVYGAVALLVKIDDVGIRMRQTGRWEITRSIGSGLVAAMPNVLWLISVIGTAAMLWVGGSIIVHALHEMHVSLPYETIKQTAKAIAGEDAPGLNWLVTALIDAIIGIILGSILIPIVEAVLAPIEALFPEKKKQPASH